MLFLWAASVLLGTFVAAKEEHLWKPLVHPVALYYHFAQ